MPKIPTFQAEGTITQEAGVTRTGISVPLTQTIGAALSPLTKTVAEHAVKEKNFENRTEALKLENESLLELTDVFDRASRLDNKEQAFELVKTESERIKNIYSNRASNNFVKTAFNNNFYGEVQKGIFKVNNRVSTNIIQSLEIEVGKKKNRLLTDALFGDNQLSKELIITELTKLYEENYQGRIDKDQYDSLILNIPKEIETFEADKLITDDPKQALIDLKNPDKFTNLLVNERQALIRDAKYALAPQIRDNVKNYLATLDAGQPIDIDETLIQEVLGNDYYTEFKEEQRSIKATATFKNQIYTSKLGEENNIINSFPINPESAAIDLQNKNKLILATKEKMDLLQKDPASLFLKFNSSVKNSFDTYNLEPEGTEKKSQLFSKFVENMNQAQIDMGLEEDQIKLLANNQAQSIVRDYNRREPVDKITYLQQLERDYGDNYSKVLLQLSENGLPTTAKLVSYLNDETFALEATSVDTAEERKRLDNFVLGETEYTKSNIRQDISEKLEDFRSVVFTANPFSTTQANAELDNIQETLIYVAMNKLSTGTEYKKAIKDATDYVNLNFKLEDTYFIPRNYTSDKLTNNTLTPGHQEFLAEKAEVIKKYYLDQFDAQYFKSTDPTIPEQDLNDSMKYQMKNNGIWVNSADGSGIVYAIQFGDGSLGLVQNKNNGLLKINFDDFSLKLPTTNIIMDFEPPKSLEEEVEQL